MSESTRSDAGDAASSKQFRVWAAGDSHVGTDKRNGRLSLHDSLKQSEFGSDDGGPAFDWDIMIDIGDLSGSQTPPDDEEGAEVVSQYSVMKKHHRSQIYNIVGNHDASGEDEPTQWWFKKYGDPLGENTPHSGVDPAKRPFPVEGHWDRYKFQAGNVLFLLMGDRNDGGPPVGRGEKGGYPAGAVTGETFDWWVDQVESNQDKIIVTAHHHMLKNTTTGSGEWEGFDAETDRYGKRVGRYHGYFKDGGPMGSGYLYFVDGHPDAQAFERYLEQHPGSIDLWLGGHTHAHPDDNYCGRTLCERKWDVTFLNVAAMTRFHANRPVPPKSRLLTFTEGSNELDMQCYIHTSEFLPVGWYDSVRRVAPLRHQFVSSE